MVKTGSLLNIFAIALFLTACDWERSSDPVVPLWMGPQEIAADEDALVREDIRNAWNRRQAYFESGVEPDVPPDISLDIGPENLEFVGFAEIGAEPVAPPEGSLGDTTCEDDVEALTPLAATPVWGYFINSAGETWRWRPQDPVTTYMRVRRSNLEEFIELAVREVVPNVRGANQEDHGEDDAGEEVFRADGILDSDDRHIRSAASGHSMTSIYSSWIRIGGLASDGWNPKIGVDNTMGTATKIGPRHLLTAGHTVWKGGYFFPKDWWAGEDGVAAKAGLAETDAPNGVKNIAWYFIAPKWYEGEKSSHDFAVLFLYDNASSAQFPSFGFKEDYALAGEPVWNFGIPWPQLDCVDSPLPGNDCRSSMYGHLKLVRRTEHSYVFTAHDAQLGHSGGPVYAWDNGGRSIVAIVKSKYTSEENRHLKIRGFVFDTLVAVLNARPSTFCEQYGWSGPGCG